ncbi:hypothetical protein Taro_005524 [Colocasia esculenta]|uniref:Uncharacterized protein n=1 Tax=Colocasia esculenta TaxID=4460 RepID=A0A843TUT0_COLES|nr:hypothetical protein [Colocasia esculenta]
MCRARGFVYVASSTTPTVVTSPVGCPRFFVSQAVSSGLCPGTCVVPSRSVSSDLDTLTLVFELHVRLRERQHALVVRGTDTSLLTGPQLVLFQCLTLESSGPGSLEVSGMGLRPCGLQVVSAVVLGEFPTEPVTSEAHPYPHR